jgi:ABC-2 type transport system ATP-binding protein
MHSAIRLEHVSKNFGPELVLRDVCHDFETGKIHGIVGNNGSGKTVLMKCICGFLLPTQGKVFVHDKQVGKDVDFPDNLGLIIETPGFLPGLSGRKNLSILASLRGRIKDATVRATMEQVGLDPTMKKPVSKYSLGMRQRLGIAQAIMENPSLLILDEPGPAFSGQDHFAR